jgi:hypothetical protein
MAAGELSPRDNLLRMTNTYEASQEIYVAATLGIADLLEEAPGARRTRPKLRGRTHNLPDPTRVGQRRRVRRRA